MMWIVVESSGGARLEPSLFLKRKVAEIFVLFLCGAQLVLRSNILTILYL
jgi:hypothetical protein